MLCTLMAVKYFAWDDDKNAKLRAERRIGFEDIVFNIERGNLFEVLAHPNPSDTPASGSSCCLCWREPKFAQCTSEDRSGPASPSHAMNHDPQSGS